MRLKKRNIVQFFVLFLVISCFFLFDRLFFYNSYIDQYYYFFIIYGVIPLALMVNLNDYDKVLMLWSFFSIFTGVLYLFDPILSYQWTGDYMLFGFEAMLPAFCGSCIAYYYYKKKWIAPFAIIFFIELVIFANKGSIFTAILIFATSFYWRVNSHRRNVWIVIIFILCSLLFVFKNEVLNFFIILEETMNFESYSLHTLSLILDKSNDDMFLGRSDLWSDFIAITENNLIFGSGIGTLESITGNYAHNIILDIINTFGVIIGTVIIVVVIFLTRLAIKNAQGAKKYFFAMMCLLAFSPLMFSLTFWKSMAFWVLMGGGLYNRTFIGNKLK